MILKINPKVVTAVNIGGTFNTENVAVGELTLYNKDGTQIYSNTLDNISDDPSNQDEVIFKDGSDYGVIGSLYYNGQSVVVNIPLPFVFNNCPLGIRFVASHLGENLTLYKMFNFYGYDFDLDLFLMAESLSNQTLATFIVIDSPLTNVKNIYKNNNSKANNIIFYLNDRPIKHNDFSIQLSNDSELWMYSQYSWTEGQQVRKTTHSSPKQTLVKFQIHPEIFLEKTLSNDTIKAGDEISFNVLLNFSSQKKFYKDLALTNVGKNFAIDIKVYDASEALVSHHIHKSYITNTEDMVSFSTPPVLLSEPGEHRIEATYSILGEDASKGLTGYEKNVDYIIAFDSDPSLIGDIISITEDVVKTSTLTLIPCISNTSNLVFNTYYREPYAMNVTSNPDEVLLHSESNPIILSGGARISSVKKIYDYVINDDFIVYDLFTVEKSDIDSYKISNLISEPIYFNLYRLENEQKNFVQQFTIAGNKSMNLVIADGIYVFEISDVQNISRDDYVKSLIIIHYPTVLKAELDFMSMLMNDCVGKDIDYRVFYDFTAFNFLTNILYKLVSNIETFYYIYNEPINSSVLSQLYTIDVVLNRVKEYIAEYDRKRK